MKKKQIIVVVKLLFHWIPIIAILLSFPFFIDNYRFITWIYVGLVFICYGLEQTITIIEKYLEETEED